MLLRWIVGNYLRQTAEGAVQETLRQAARVVQHAAPGELPQIPAHYQTAVVFGLAVESAGFQALLTDPAAARFGNSVEHWGPLAERHVRVVEVGTGAERAAAGTRELIARARPTWVIAAGFATGLAPELQRGDIVMADTIADDHGTTVQVGLHIDEQTVAATPHLRVGKLLSSDHVLATPEERQQAAMRSGAIACDQESLAVASVCHERKVRFLAVRVVTDLLGDRLPAEVEQFLRQKSFSARLGVAAGAVFQRPGTVKDLWSLRDDAHRASRHLALFLRGVIAQLPVESSTLKVLNDRSED